MTHVLDYCEGNDENIENEDDTFTEIKKKLLDDFDTAETVRKVLKGSSKIGDSREPVKVYLRVKPLTGKEIAAGESQGCLEIENSNTVALHPPKTSFNFKHRQSRITGETIQRFSFTRVFGPETNQKKFFEDTSLDVVKDFINGQNCLVFSYGITNAGKTYTILGNSQNLGVLPRTINILFNSFKNQNYERSNLKPRMFCDVHKLSSIQEEEEESKKKLLLSLNDVPTYHQSISSTDLSLGNSSQEQCSSEDVNLSSLLDVTSVDIDDQGPIQFCLWISFAEIYNEHIYDLLEPISMNKDGKRTVLRVGNDRKSNPYIKGLTYIHVNTADEALELLKIGRKNQKIASTKLNENSSRSHCIFTLKILRVVNTKEPHVARVSRLSFVDLAGSERYTKTQNTGVRLKESGNINTSIMTLGKCVELLRYNQNHVNNQKNVPFRESKLTRLFQGFFCGRGKASMIVNVNQCASAFDETLHALKFSAIAKKVTTVVHEPRAAAAEVTQPPARSTRSSVAWADGSLSTPAQTKSQQIYAVAEENAIRRTPFTGNQDYQKLIVLLQEQLIEERKEKALMEVKIREEVCQEMAEQLVEIEKNYNERMVEEQRAVEELYEKRIDILSKSVKKARKRPRMERVQDDDDEWVSSVLLHKEQVKNKELSERISELEEKLETVEEERALKESENTRKQLPCVEEKSVGKDMEVQVEIQSKKVSEMTAEVEHLKNEIRVKDDKIKSIEDSLFVIEEMKAKEIELSEAFEQRNKMIKELEGEIARLEEDKGTVIKNLKKELASRNEDMCKRLEEELTQREVKVVALEKELAEGLRQKDDDIAKESKKGKKIEAELQEEINKLKEQKEKEVEDLRKEIEHRDEKMLQWTNVMTKNEKLMEKLDEASEQLKKKDSESTELVEKMKRMNASKSEECENLRNELICRGEQIEQLERTLKDCKLELEAKSSRLMAVKKVQGGRSSTPTKPGQNNIMKQLEKRIQESTAALDKKNSQLISKNNAITKLENNTKELRQALSEKEQELSELQAENEQLQLNDLERVHDNKDVTINELRTALREKEQAMSKLQVMFEQLNGSKGKEDSKDETINELNAQLKEWESNLLSKSKEKEETEENLKFVEGELEILTCKEKELQEELRKVKENHNEMKEEAEKWKLEVESRREVERNMKKQLEAQRVIVKEHESNIEELKRVIERKEDDLRQCKDLHNKKVAELNKANEDLQQGLATTRRDLLNLQGTVELRNRKLEDMENLDSSLKEEHRCKISRLNKELENTREELRKRDKNFNKIKSKMELEMEKKTKNEILKVNENWEAASEQMKRGIAEQEEVTAQMETDLASKEDEITCLRSQLEKLQQLDTQTVEKLSRENENLDEQCERYKIKIFELETEVEKLQQDARKETTKKDTATQALRDGLEIVKAKKLEYEAKMNEVEKETEELKKGFEIKIADLEQEVTRLKSVSGSESDEKTDSAEQESGSSCSGDANYVYKPIEVESFNMPGKDRVEIDVTPITGTGLPKGGKKTKSLKRKSSDLTLREIQLKMAMAKNGNGSDEDFTPVSVKKTKKNAQLVGIWTFHKTI